MAGCSVNKSVQGERGRGARGDDRLFYWRLDCSPHAEPECKASYNADVTDYTNRLEKQLPAVYYQQALLCILINILFEVSLLYNITPGI